MVRQFVTVAVSLIGVLVLAVLAIFGLFLLGGFLFKGGASADTIIQQRYEKCIAVGGTYKQGGDFDSFSCTVPTRTAG